MFSFFFVFMKNVLKFYGFKIKCQRNFHLKKNCNIETNKQIHEPVSIKIFAIEMF